jgi:hypothetical protein
MKKRYILLVIFLAGCMQQAPPTELRQLDISPGTKGTFEFYENGVFLGTVSYIVEKKDIYNGEEAYFIHEVVDLQGSGLKMYIDASYVVDLYGRALYYEFEAQVNDETQTMKAEFLGDHVHEIASRPGKDFDKTVKIGENTFTLDNNMIGQWDMMFRFLKLELGANVVANGFAAQPISAFTVTGKITEMVSLEISQHTYDCFKMDFSTPPYYMYVTDDGILLKMETKDGTLVIVRKE